MFLPIGLARCWNNCCRMPRSDPLCIPNQMGFHGDGRRSFCGCHRSSALWNCGHVDPRPNHAIGVCVSRRIAVLCLSDLWVCSMSNSVNNTRLSLIYLIFLHFSTQMMMGGKHKYSISPEEYIFAALNLYIDIVNIFLYLLTILSATRD